MEYAKIIGLTYDMLDSYKASIEYQKLVELNQFIKTKYKEELETYLQAFKAFDEVFTIGPYHPDFKEVSKKYQQAKITLFEKEEVKDYFKYERLINEKLEQLSKTINELIPSEGTSCVK